MREPLLAPGQSRDLAGLALLALGLFSALVEWGGYDGALAGSRLHDSLVVLVGRAAGLAPVVLVAGCRRAARPRRGSPAAARSGSAACSSASAC